MRWSDPPPLLSSYYPEGEIGASGGEGSKLTFSLSSCKPLCGTPLPNEGRPIWKDGANEHRNTGGAAGQSALFLRPVRQDSRLDPRPPQQCADRPLASL